MRIKSSGRTQDSAAAIQQLADFLEKFGEVNEVQENILTVDNRERILVAYSAQSYYERRGYYWFSLAKTKYAQMLKWSEDHAWMILLCGNHGRYFIPFGQIKALLDNRPSKPYAQPTTV